MMKRIFFSFLLLLSFSANGWALWYNDNFAYKQRITISLAQVSGGPHTSFPVLITEANLDANFFNHIQQSSPANLDVIFTNGAETTELNREVVIFSTSGPRFEAWVKVDLSGTASTDIYMYYGSATAHVNNSTTWSNGYAGVWHATDVSSPLRDSTSNANNGTCYGGLPDSQTGKIGACQDSNGNGDYADMGNPASLNITGHNPLMLEGWVYVRSIHNDWNTYISKGDSQYCLQTANNSSVMQFVVWNSGGGATFHVAQSDANVSTDAWHYIVGRYEAGGTNEVALYIDGIKQIATTTSTNIANTTYAFELFRNSENNTQQLDGRLDEVRVSNVSRTNGWITTCYNNQNSPGSFYSASSELVRIQERFRSIGPGNIAALATGGANGLAVANNTATFQSGIANIIGVGDVIQYDANHDGTIDSLAFIHARINAQTFTVYSVDGQQPIATSTPPEQNWAIYRAYTAMANAVGGTENIGILAALRNFDTAAHDITGAGNNEIWFFACYGDNADTTAVNWTGWTTDAAHYIKLYTPTLATEVGTSQRHTGIWDTGAYRLEVSNATPLRISINYARLEGLQIANNGINGNDIRGLTFTGLANGTGDCWVSDCIVVGTAGTNRTGHWGITIESNGTGTYILRAWNNLVYNYFSTTGGGGRGFQMQDASSTSYLYNNTVYHCNYGYRLFAGAAVVKNSIAQNCEDGYSPYTPFSGDSDYNISDIAVDAPGIYNATDKIVQFVNAGAADFHLADGDNQARDAGTNLSADVVLAFNDDIDLDARPVVWDIGADQNLHPKPTPTATLTATISPTTSMTSTVTATRTVTATPTISMTPSSTRTATESATVTATRTITSTPTISMTPTESVTATRSPTITRTFTITATATNSPVFSPTITPTVTQTSTLTLTATISPTATYTLTCTITPTYTITPTSSKTPTVSPTRTMANSPTMTATPSITPVYVAANNLDRVVVYPNPKRLEKSVSAKITFLNMPVRAVIRIFDMSGQLVATINKDDNLPFVSWDLKNQGGQKTASGVYIYIIKTPAQQIRGKLVLLK